MGDRVVLQGLAPEDGDVDAKSLNGETGSVGWLPKNDPDKFGRYGVSLDNHVHKRWYKPENLAKGVAKRKPSAATAHVEQGQPSDSSNTERVPALGPGLARLAEQWAPAQLPEQRLPAQEMHRHYERRGRVEASESPCSDMCQQCCGRRSSKLAEWSCSCACVCAVWLWEARDNQFVEHGTTAGLGEVWDAGRLEHRDVSAEGSCLPEGWFTQSCVDLLRNPVIYDSPSLDAHVTENDKEQLWKDLHVQFSSDEVQAVRTIAGNVLQAARHPTDWRCPCPCEIFCPCDTCLKCCSKGYNNWLWQQNGRNWEKAEEAHMVSECSARCTELSQWNQAVNAEQACWSAMCFAQHKHRQEGERAENSAPSPMRMEDSCQDRYPVVQAWPCSPDSNWEGSEDAPGASARSLRPASSKQLLKPKDKEE